MQSKENGHPGWTIVWGALSLVTVAALIVLATRPHRQPAPSNPVVASVNDTLIRQSDVRKMSPPMDSSEALALLVDFTLLDQAAARKKITVSDTEMQSLRANVTSDAKAATYTEAATKMRHNTYALDLQLRHARILEDLSATELTRPPDMIHARGILVRIGGKHASTRAEALSYARKVDARIRRASDVAKLAHDLSDDKLSASHGGDLGIVQNAMPMETHYSLDNRFTNALCAAASTGRIDSPVGGDNGYWVVRVLSTSAHPVGDAEDYRHVMSFWRRFWLKRLEPGVMGRLRSKAVIQPPLEMDTSGSERRGA